MYVVFIVALLSVQSVFFAVDNHVIVVNLENSDSESRQEIKNLLASAGLSDESRSSLTRFCSLATDHAPVKLLRRMSLSLNDLDSVLAGDKQLDIRFTPEDKVRIYYVTPDDFSPRDDNERMLVCMRHRNA